MPPMPNKLRAAVGAQSYNGRYEARWPAGDKPNAGAVLSGDAAAVAAGGGDIATAIRMAGDAASMSSAAGDLTAGGIADGANYTISGSGFGTNPSYVKSWLGGPSGYIQGAANDASFAGNLPSSNWSALINDWRISNGNARSSIRDKCLRWQTADARNNAATKYAGTMQFDPGRAALQSCYIHYLQYFTHANNQFQYKQLRLVAKTGFAAYSDSSQPNIYQSGIFAGSGAVDGDGTIAYNGVFYQGKYGNGAEFYGDVTAPNISSGRPVSEGIWVRTEWEFLDSTSTNADGFLRIRHTNAATGAAIGLMEIRNLRVYTTGSESPIGLIVPQLYTEIQPGPGTPDGNNSNVWMQDWLINIGSRARIVIGSASTYSASMPQEVCSDSAWSDTSITFEINQGALSSLSGKYIYVFKSDGTLWSTSGIPLV